MKKALAAVNWLSLGLMATVCFAVETSFCIETPCHQKVVQSSGLNLRSDPQLKANIVATLPLNSRVCLEKKKTIKSKAWSYITTEIDRDTGGWVLTKFLGSKATDGLTALEKAAAALKKNNASEAVKWSERAAQTNENSESLGLLLKSYSMAGDEKKIAQTKTRLHTYQQLNPGDQDLTLLAESTPFINESSKLSKILNCPSQVTKKNRLTEPYTSMEFQRVLLSSQNKEALTPLEVLLPTKSDNLIEVRTLQTLNQLLLDPKLEKCFFTSDAKLDCSLFLRQLNQIRKAEKEDGLGPHLKFISEQFLDLESQSQPKNWSQHKVMLFQMIQQNLNDVLDEAHGITLTSEPLASTSEFDRYWLEKNYFVAKKNHQTITFDTYAFIICNFFELTLSDVEQKDQTLGPMVTLELAQSEIESKRPQRGLELLTVAAEEFKEYGWVSSRHKKSATYAAEAEDKLNKIKCQNSKANSQQFKNAADLASTLKHHLESSDPDSWPEMFSCHSLQYESSTSSFTELISNKKAILLILESKDEILGTKAQIDEHKRRVQFKRIRFDLDKTGRLFRIVKMVK